MSLTATFREPIPVPANLVNLIGESNGLDAVIEQIIRNKNQTDEDVQNNLCVLGRYKKIKVKFTEPQQIVTGHRWKQVTEHVFNGFFRGKVCLCYLLKSGGKTGYRFPSLHLVESYEPVISALKEFASLAEFKKKFDTRFITETEIEKLWNSKSSQHGGKYNKDDFHRIGRRGLEVMQEFLRFFKGVNDGGGPGYIKREEDGYSIRNKRYLSYHHLGRDISISHQTNLSYVYYSSEYSGCSNGRYGLVANEREFLWLEDD